MPNMLVPGEAPLETLLDVYENAAVPRLDPSCFDRMRASASRRDGIVGGEEAHYGINTGFGKLAHAVRPGVVNLLSSMLERDVLPVVPDKVAVSAPNGVPI